MFACQAAKRAVLRCFSGLGTAGGNAGLMRAEADAGGPKAEGRKSRDTASLTYRCFLPDLTRFVSVCCAGSGPNALVKG